MPFVQGISKIKKSSKFNALKFVTEAFDFLKFYVLYLNRQFKSDKLTMKHKQPENKLFFGLNKNLLHLLSYKIIDMQVLKRLLEIYEDEELIKADGFDDAIIGIEEHTMRLIYSVKKILKTLQKDMPEDESLEYFYHNISCSYVGEKTPIWCYDCI